MTTNTTLPSLPWVVFPLKVTEETDFTGPFRRYIEEAYGDDPDKYSDAIETLQRLRNEVSGVQHQTQGQQNIHGGRDILYRYYGQLGLLDLRFPIEDTKVKVLFTWWVCRKALAISCVVLSRCFLCRCLCYPYISPQPSTLSPSLSPHISFTFSPSLSPSPPTQVRVL